MRRLYWQIYLTALAILVLFWVLIAFFWVFFEPRSRDEQLFEGVANVVFELIPGADRSVAEQEAALGRLAEWFEVELALFDAQGHPVVVLGEELPAPSLEKRSGWRIDPGHGPTASLRLRDGRFLVVRHRKHPSRALFGLLALLLAIGIGTYPVVRRLTGRLERLQREVQSLGEGRLATRVPVEGKDEVAALAASFNRTAERIERLVTAQRQILAGASHELRTPLTRMRVAIESLGKGDAVALRSRLQRDIAELDALIEELLLASRLNAGEDLEENESLDLLAVAAEEAAAYGLEVEGESVDLEADLRLLRRLARNLLDNAHRHAGGEGVRVEVRSVAGYAVLRVSDTGPGIPAGERERIFEPFYRPPSTVAGGAASSGLGLSLVRRIALRYGGDVSWRPGTEGGSCFEVRIPTTG